MPDTPRKKRHKIVVWLKDNEQARCGVCGLPLLSNKQGYYHDPRYAAKEPHDA